MNLKNTLRIDFTGTASGFEFHEGFSEQLIVRLRSLASNEAFNKVIIMIDNGFTLDHLVPHLVKDHLNLTGTNPLVGPNHPRGPRFPVVNDIYITEFPSSTLSRSPQGIAAGLTRNNVPSPDELNLLKSLGADFYCYNIVPSMIVAAHAGFKVIGVVIPEGTQPDKELLVALTEFQPKEVP